MTISRSSDIVGALVREGWIGWAVLAVFALGVLDGLVGVYEHVRGVAERIGGFSLRNLMAGPPVFLPASFLAVSLTALVAIAWDSL